MENNQMFSQSFVARSTLGAAAANNNNGTGAETDP